MSPGRFSESRAINGARIARGCKPVPPPNRELRGFLVPRTAGAPDGRGEQFHVLGSAAALREQQLKGVVLPSAETRGVVRGIRNTGPNVGVSGIHNPLLRAEPGAESIRVRESKAAKLRLEGTVPTRPPEVPFHLIPRGDGTYTFETVTHGPLVSREKFVEATAEYFATVFGDPLFTVATEFWHTESDPVTETVGAIEGVSGWLQITVDKPLKGLSTALGLSPGEAAVTAGISTDLILAPITGPLDKAESFIEAGGIIFGLLTGGHGLVLACVKLLVHNQAKRLAVRGAVKALGGSRTARRRSATPGARRHNLRLPSDAQRTAAQQAPVPAMLRHQEQPNVLRPPYIPAPEAAPMTSRQPTPSELLWQGLAFAQKPPTGSGPAPATTAPKRRATKPIVPLVSDNAFLETLPGALRDGSGTEPDVPTARRSRRLSPGEHGILKIGGVGFGTSSGSRSFQAAYQHPGCLTGRCVPPGCPPCLCPCGVCRPDLRSEYGPLQRLPRQPPVLLPRVVIARLGEPVPLE